MSEEQLQINQLDKTVAVLANKYEEIGKQISEFRRDMNIKMDKLDNNYGLKLIQLENDLKNIDRVKVAKNIQDKINDDLYSKSKANEDCIIALKIDKAIIDGKADQRSVNTTMVIAIVSIIINITMVIVYFIK